MNAFIDTSIITIHGAQRAKERQNLKNLRSVEKSVQLAIQRGKGPEDYSSWERVFLSTAGKNDCTALAYNNFCYIFNTGGACVTLYPLPVWFGKKKRFHGKERIRNYKQYCRNNADFSMREVLS